MIMFSSLPIFKYSDGLITFGRTRAMQLRERNELEQKRKMLTLIDDEHQDYTFNSDQYQDAEQQQPQQHMKHHHDDLTVELQGNESKFVQHLNVMPTFDLSISENITIAENDTATLNCRVHNLGTKSVSSMHREHWVGLQSRQAETEREYYLNYNKLI